MFPTFKEKGISKENINDLCNQINGDAIKTFIEDLNTFKTKLNQEKQRVKDNPEKEMQLEKAQQKVTRLLGKSDGQLLDFLTNSATSILLRFKNQFALGAAARSAISSGRDYTKTKQNASNNFETIMKAINRYKLTKSDKNFAAYTTGSVVYGDKNAKNNERFKSADIRNNNELVYLDQQTSGGSDDKQEDVSSKIGGSESEQPDSKLNMEELQKVLEAIWNMYSDKPVSSEVEKYKNKIKEILGGPKSKFKQFKLSNGYNVGNNFNPNEIRLVNEKYRNNRIGTIGSEIGDKILKNNEVAQLLDTTKASAGNWDTSFKIKLKYVLEKLFGEDFGTHSYLK